MPFNAVRVLTSVTLILAAIVLPMAPGGDRCRAEERFDHAEMTRQVFFAVSEGLYRDGVSRDVAARLVEVDADGWPVHFVSGCPVCMPAFNAVRGYAEQPPFVGLKLAGEAFGPGLAPELRSRLLGDELKPRLDALHELVATWMGRRMEALRLERPERAVWDERLQEMRKLGMSSLQSLQRENGERAVPAAYAAMTSCAVCDGANDAGGGR